MSRLKLYCPEGPDAEISNASADDEPVILSFATFAVRIKGSQLVDVVARARVIDKNRLCPFCKHSAVEPIELQDAILNTGSLPIPGTATLVGFHCSDCRAEWPI